LLDSSVACDVLVSSGGVSVGDKDHVREVLGESGSVDLWKIAMKPGRPLTFGFTRHQQPYFAGISSDNGTAIRTASIKSCAQYQHCILTSVASTHDVDTEQTTWTS